MTTKRELAMEAVRRAVCPSTNGESWQNRSADEASDGIRYLPLGTFADEVTWQPMSTVAHVDGEYVLLRHVNGARMVVYWTIDGDKPGWWLPEGSLFQDSDFTGWCEIPQ